MRSSRYPLLFSALCLLGGGLAYLGARLVAPLELGWPMKALLALLLSAPFGAVAWLPLVHWRRRGEALSRWHAMLVETSYLSLGLLSFLGFACVMRDVALLVSRLHGAVPWWLAAGAGSTLVVASALGMLLLAHWESRRTPPVREVRIPVENLHPSLEGFRIAQISDLHVGHTIGKKFVERVVERLNALEPQLVALTGDIVDGRVRDLESEVAPLAKLRASHGAYYVTGNHEYYWGASEWIAAMSRLGITPLIDEERVIDQAGAKLLVAGVPDYWGESFLSSKNADSERKRDKALPTADFRLLLAHQPKSAFRAARRGFDLQICGHTHGGQFLPWTFVIRFFQPFVRGLNRLGDMWLYVSRGTGSWGPPLRLGAPSEITLLVLTEAARVPRPKVRKSMPLPDAA